MDTTSNQLEEPLLAQDPETGVASTSMPTDNNANSAAHPHVVPDDEVHHHVSRNIPVMLSFQFLRCGAEAIWLGSVLTAYVYLIKPNNPEVIGYLSAVEGITQFVAACVAGILADKYRRDILLQGTSLIGITASILIVASPLTGIFVFLVIALMLNGAFDGIGLTASLALFADSIQEGDRSYYFTQRELCTTMGQVLGPLCGLVMFYCMGDQWTLHACGRVMIAAQILLVPAFGLLWLFRDADTATAENNNEDDDDEETASTPLLQEQSDTPADGETNPLATTTETADNDNESSDEQSALFLRVSKHRLIATTAAGSDIVCAFASGISCRYFSLFLLHNLQFGPVLVQILDALSQLMGGGLLVCAQRVSLRFGRCHTSVIFKMVGIGCLLAMVVSYKHLYHHNNADTSSDSGDSQHKHNQYHVIMICAFYLLQNAFLNSTEALTRSLIMDNVPSGERARWAALESINIFGWCGSAAIGGIIVKRFQGDVLPVFFVTAVLQVVGSLPLVALFGIDTKEQQQQPQQPQQRQGEEVALVEEQRQQLQ